MSHDVRQIASDFFAAYADRDVKRMVAACTSDATVEYVPMGREGVGLVSELGVQLWTGFFEAFQDFTPDVQKIWSDDDQGTAVVRTINRGKHVGAIAGIQATGRTLAAPHVFILETDGPAISKLAAFWDNETIYNQIGRPGG